MAKVKADTQWGLRRAKKSGLRIVEPAPNELQLDLDGLAELSFYRQQMAVLRKNLPAAETWTEKVTPSKTPGRFHVTISTSPLVPLILDDPELIVVPNVMRVVLQTVLGSDLRRECFNLCRVLNGTKYPIVFFEEDK